MRTPAVALCVALVALAQTIQPAAALTSSTLSVYAFPSNPAANGLVHITATVKAGGSAAGGVSVALSGPGSITPSSQATNSYGERRVTAQERSILSDAGRQMRKSRVRAC